MGLHVKIGEGKGLYIWEDGSAAEVSDHIRRYKPLEPREGELSLPSNPLIRPNTW